jgi:type II secretory pathway pseudopilin PulG
LKLTEALKVRRASREQQAIEQATATLKRRLSKQQQQSGTVETSTDTTATDNTNEVTTITESQYYTKISCIIMHHISSDSTESSITQIGRSVLDIAVFCCLLLCGVLNF